MSRVLQTGTPGCPDCEEEGRHCTHCHGHISDGHVSPWDVISLAWRIEGLEKRIEALEPSKDGKP